MKNNKPLTDDATTDGEKAGAAAAKISEIWAKFLNLSPAQQSEVLTASRKAADKMPSAEAKNFCNEFLDLLESFAQIKNKQQPTTKDQ